jgi:N-acetylmuramoyl-L-alanine amidase
LGHEEVSPGRKIDPGPAFPLDELRKRLLSAPQQQTAAKDNTSTTSGRVNTALLNMRTEPNASAALAGSALKSGTELTVNEVQDGWYKVTVATTGWVAAKYVELEKGNER